MKIDKIKLAENCFLIAVTDEKDNVIAAGAFAYQDEAETAANIVNTLLIKKDAPKKGKAVKLGDLVKMMAAR